MPSSMRLVDGPTDEVVGAGRALRTPPEVSGGLPGLGHALEFNRDREGLARRGFAEHGSAFSVRLGPKHLAMVVGTDHQRTFFMETGHRLESHSIYGFLKAIVGEVMFVAPHDEYLRQRPLLKDLFGREKMVRYIEIIEQVVQRWIDELGDEGEIEISAAMTHLVQQCAGACFLGPDLMSRVGEEFWELFGDLSDALDPLLPPNLPLPKFRRRDRAKARLSEVFEPIIRARRDDPDAYDDLLQDLIMGRTADGELADEDLLRNLMLGVVFASHETTIGQAAWNLILLLQHPEFLRRVQDEIDEVAPGATRIDHTVLARLPHLGWTVREVERLRPSVDLLMRLAAEDITFGDFVVPAGWLVQIVQGVSHRLPDLFERPDEFDPLRFAPGREEDKQDRFAMFGFGGGIHKCPGMSFANAEMSIILALMFRELELELLTPDPHVVSTLGANRASPAQLRYRRRATATAARP